MILRNLSALKSIPHKKVVVIGNFDGFHLGHQTIINQGKLLANKLDAKLVLLTFHPHPAKFFAYPNVKVEHLFRKRQKLSIAKELGFDIFLSLPFNHHLASLDAKIFLDQLCHETNIVGIVSGDDFCFGKGRTGNKEFLQNYAKDFAQQLSYISVPQFKIDDIVVSTSKIKELIKNKSLEMTKLFLGRDYQLIGRVVKGRGDGRKLGFPTANIKFAELISLPLGVYNVQIIIDNEIYNGTCNYGIRPSFNLAPNKILEVHIHNFQSDIYGKRVTICFKSFLRVERQYPSINELILQINSDIEKSKEYFRETL